MGFLTRYLSILMMFATCASAHSGDLQDQLVSAFKRLKENNAYGENHNCWEQNCYIISVSSGTTPDTNYVVVGTVYDNNEDDILSKLESQRSLTTIGADALNATLIAHNISLKSSGAQERLYVIAV